MQWIPLDNKLKASEGNSGALGDQAFSYVEADGAQKLDQHIGLFTRKIQSAYEDSAYSEQHNENDTQYKLQQAESHEGDDGKIAHELMSFLQDEGRAESASLPHHHPTSQQFRAQDQSLRPQSPPPHRPDVQRDLKASFVTFARGGVGKADADGDKGRNGDPSNRRNAHDFESDQNAIDQPVQAEQQIGHRPEDSDPVFSASFRSHDHRVADSWDTREFLDEASEVPPERASIKDCTCSKGHKLDCPVHGLNAPNNRTLEWSLPENNPVGPNETWQHPYTSRVAAHHINRKPGQAGKWIKYHNGDIDMWPIDRFEAPHHDEEPGTLTLPEGWTSTLAPPKIIHHPLEPEWMEAFAPDDRTPMIYHAPTNTLHIGDPGMIHEDVGVAMGKKGYNLSLYRGEDSAGNPTHHGWLGENNEAIDSDPLQNDSTPREYGWYGEGWGSGEGYRGPGPHVDKAIEEHFNAHNVEPNGGWDFTSAVPPLQFVEPYLRASRQEIEADSTGWMARRPFVYHEPTNTVYMGGPGEFHGHIYEKYPDLSSGPIGVHEGFEQSRAPIHVEFYSPKRVPNHNEIIEQISQHTGYPATYSDDKDPKWDFGGFTSAAPLPFGLRTPFIYDPDNDQVYMGEQGAIHQEVYDHYGLPYSPLFSDETAMAHGEIAHSFPQHAKWLWPPSDPKQAYQALNRVADEAGVPAKQIKNNEWDFTSAIQVEHVEPGGQELGTHDMDEDEWKANGEQPSAEQSKPFIYVPDHNKIYVGDPGWYHDDLEEGIFGIVRNKPTPAVMRGRIYPDGGIHAYDDLPYGYDKDPRQTSENVVNALEGYTPKTNQWDFTSAWKHSMEAEWRCQDCGKTVFDPPYSSEHVKNNNYLDPGTWAECEHCGGKLKYIDDHFSSVGGNQVSTLKFSPIVTRESVSLLPAPGLRDGDLRLGEFMPVADKRIHGDHRSTLTTDRAAHTSSVQTNDKCYVDDEGNRNNNHRQRIAAWNPSGYDLGPRHDSQCYEYAESLEHKYPQLKQESGFYVHPVRGVGDHSWNVAPDGTIVDVTAEQHREWPKGKDPRSMRFDENEMAQYAGPKMPEIVGPTHPHYERYVSYERQPERAMQLAHENGEHYSPQDYADVCPACATQRGYPETVANGVETLSHPQSESSHTRDILTHSLFDAEPDKQTKRQHAHNDAESDDTQSFNSISTRFTEPVSEYNDQYNSDKANEFLKDSHSQVGYHTLTSAHAAQHAVTSSGTSTASHDSQAYIPSELGLRAPLFGLKIGPRNPSWSFLDSDHTIGSHLSADKLRWVPGTKGKGSITNAFDVHTWPVDNGEQPSHANGVPYRDAAEFESMRHFTIAPNGVIVPSYWQPSHSIPLDIATQADPNLTLDRGPIGSRLAGPLSDGTGHRLGWDTDYAELNAGIHPEDIQHGWGKGILDSRGNVHTWNTDAEDGFPTHSEYLQSSGIGQNYMGPFEIHPSGEVETFSGRPHEWPEIYKADPRLFPKEGEDWDFSSHFGAKALTVHENVGYEGYSPHSTDDYPFYYHEPSHTMWKGKYEGLHYDLEGKMPVKHDELYGGEHGWYGGRIEPSQNKIEWYYHRDGIPDRVQDVHRELGFEPYNESHNWKNPWDFSSAVDNHLTWNPGTWGKGILFGNGYDEPELHTWPTTEDHDGDPTHGDYLMKIDPQGKIDWLNEPERTAPIIKGIDSRISYDPGQWNFTATTVVPINHPRSRGHGEGEPIIHDPETDTVYIGPQGSYHWDMYPHMPNIDKGALEGLNMQLESPTVAFEGLNNGRVEGDHVEWYKWPHNFEQVNNALGVQPKTGWDFASKTANIPQVVPVAEKAPEDWHEEWTTGRRPVYYHVPTNRVYLGPENGSHSALLDRHENDFEHDPDMWAAETKDGGDYYGHILNNELGWWRDNSSQERYPGEAAVALQTHVPGLVVHPPDEEVWDFTASGLNVPPDPSICFDCRGAGCPLCEYTGLNQIGPMQDTPDRLPEHGPVQIGNDEPGVATIGA